MMYTAVTVLVLGLAGAVPPAAADPAVTPDRSTATGSERVDAQHTYHELSARHSDKCLDVRGESTEDGAEVIQYDCHDSENQQWEFDDAD